MTNTRIIRTTLVAALVLLAVPALAQQGQLEVVEVKEIDNPPVIWSIVLMGLLGLLALGANAIPSNRGHQD